MRLLNHIFLFLLLLICVKTANAQQVKISGFIFNEKSQPIPNVSIIVLKESSDEIVTFSQTDDVGFFNLNLPANTHKNVILKINYLGYSEIYEEISIASDTPAISKNFVLKISIENNLKPVYVIAENRGVKTKNDTTTYTLEKFKDGTEIKIEDILKKLPGIEVFEDGKIQYKGKDISKVLLEGDDLFNHNYTIGTRNISVDMVDQVEAIERYSENPILKGIEFTDKIALNLKLKEGVTDFSGNATVGVGYELKFYLDLIGLTISKKAKNFSTIHYNNTGTNSSPYDFSSNTISLELLQEEDYKTTPVLTEPLSTGLIKNENFIENNNRYASTNQIMALTAKTVLRFNFSYFKDRLQTETQNSTFYSTSVDSTVFNQKNSITARPLVFNGDYKLTFNKSKSALWETEGKVNVLTRASIFDFRFKNQSKNTVKSSQKSFFFKQNLRYTTKLNDKNALQFNSQFTFNETPEEDNYQTQLFNTLSGYDNQKIFQSKNQIHSNLTLIGTKRKFKYSCSLNMHYTSEKFNSELSNTEDLLEIDRNEYNFQYLKPEINGSISYFINKFLIRLNASVAFNNLIYRSNIPEKDQRLSEISFNPDFTLKYVLNSKSSIETNYYYETKPLLSTYLYKNPILLNNTLIVLNKIDLQLLENQQVSAQYKFYDLYNSLGFSTKLTYRENINPIISNIKIFDEFLINEYLIIDRSNQNYTLEIAGEKLFYNLSSKFKLNFNYNNYRYYNQVDDFTLRFNKLHRYSFTFNYISAFDNVFNFGNSVNYVINKTTNSINDIENNFLKNSLTFIVRPIKNFYSKIDFDLYLPNANKFNESFLISTLSVNYKSKNNKTDYALSVNNLTNEKQFVRESITDYSQSITTQSIIPLNVLLKISFRF